MTCDKQATLVTGAVMRCGRQFGGFILCADCLAAKSRRAAREAALLIGYRARAKVSQRVLREAKRLLLCATQAIEEMRLRKATGLIELAGAELATVLP